MEPLPEYTQIVLNNDNLLPLDDLKASGGLDRKPLLPDDMPPVLALPYASGPAQPRLNTCQDDGSLNVHVVNSAGGQGIYVPPVFPEVSRQIILGPGSLWPIDGTKITQRYIYGLNMALVCTLGGGGTGDGFFVEIQGGTNNQRGQLILAVQFLATAPGGYCAPYISNQVYPVKIDALAAVNDTSWVLNMGGISGTTTFYATIGVLYGD